jgi:hypothetical protein
LVSSNLSWLSTVYQNPTAKQIKGVPEKTDILSVAK